MREIKILSIGKNSKDEMLANKLTQGIAFFVFGHQKYKPLSIFRFKNTFKTPQDVDEINEADCNCDLVLVSNRTRRHSKKIISALEKRSLTEKTMVICESPKDNAFKKRGLITSVSPTDFESAWEFIKKRITNK